MKKVLSILALLLTAVTQGTWAQTGIVNGSFSVSATKSVCFSHGNLQATYDGSSWTWAFAANQWDYIGNATANNAINGNGTVSANGTVDLFGWVGASNTTWTDAAMYGISNSTSRISTATYGNKTNEALKSNWGKTIDPTGKTWRTLTNAEMTYVFNTRSSGSTVWNTANARYTFATINTDDTGVNGIILFPDGITVEESEVSTAGTVNAASSWGTQCTAAQWVALEAKGCVFLPAAGYRGGASVTSGNHGCYWTSNAHTSNTNDAFRLYFLENQINLGAQSWRSNGHSVRLVIDEGVTLDKTAEWLAIGKTMTLTATVVTIATDKSVKWTTSNEAVATVDADGVVTAHGAGIATITATAANGTEDTSDDKTATCQITVSGLSTDESGAYLIASSDNWDTFAYEVNNGINFSGQVVKLTEDISVSTMAGTDHDTNAFRGTFEGGDHTLTINVSNQARFAAPFKGVNGATIKDLKTTGSISGTGNNDGKLLGGIVGVSRGSTTITNCVSSVTITTAYGNDAALGGLVGATRGGSVTISGCVFNGKMTGASNTRCAGFTGYEYIATTTTISNSLFAPSELTVYTVDDGWGKTFSRDGNATIINCYYTQALGRAQGALAVELDTAPDDLGDLVTDYGMVKVYDCCILFDGKYYVATPVVTVTANEGATGEYWATYYNGTTSFTADENTTVFQAALSGSSLTLTEVPNREIPATKAVILKSSSATITLTPASTTETLEGNELQGTATSITNPGNAYVLNKTATNGVGFYKLSSTGTIGANKAYLTYSGASLTRSFFGFDETTGIEMPTAEVIDADAVVYDLQGRRVAQPTKGLYIVNGKKVIIK